MKKIILMAALVLGFAVAASAQPRAVGLRGTLGGAQVSYQHTLSDSNFIDAGLGLYDTAFSVDGVYNFMLANPAWTNQGTWGIYAGPGASVGVGTGFFDVAIAGEIGLEYTFDFPLQLSIDIRPQVSLLHGFAFSGFYPALGVRYRF